MQNLNLPHYNFNIKETGNKRAIFDPFRKKFVALTPEEWVRQNFLQYMVQTLGFPQGLISVEKKLVINNMQRRYDILAYNNYAQPVLIVECKSPMVKLTQATFNQVAAYNMNINVNYLIITNGIQHIACYLNHTNNTYSFLDTLPGYHCLTTGDLG